MKAPRRSGFRPFDAFVTRFHVEGEGLLRDHKRRVLFSAVATPPEAQMLKPASVRGGRPIAYSLPGQQPAPVALRPSK